MNEQVLCRVREIASDVLQADVTPESSPETIESWDSVQHLNLVLAIEEEYGFQFLPEEMDQAKTVGCLARLVSTKRGACCLCRFCPTRSQPFPPSASSTKGCWPAGCWPAAPRPIGSFPKLPTQAGCPAWNSFWRWKRAWCEAATFCAARISQLPAPRSRPPTTAYPSPKASSTAPTPCSACAWCATPSPGNPGSTPWEWVAGTSRSRGCSSASAGPCAPSRSTSKWSAPSDSCATSARSVPARCAAPRSTPPPSPAPVGWA